MSILEPFVDLLLVEPLVLFLRHIVLLFSPENAYTEFWTPSRLAAIGLSAVTSAEYSIGFFVHYLKPHTIITDAQAEVATSL